MIIAQNLLMKNGELYEHTNLSEIGLFYKNF